MSKVVLPTKGPLLSGKGWTVFFVALIVVCAVAPMLNLLVPRESMFYMSDYAVALVGKIMCYAICALAMDLIWGYTGILSLGHGMFFALGGYMMACTSCARSAATATTRATCPTSWCSSTGRNCPGTGPSAAASS